VANNYCHAVVGCALALLVETSAAVAQDLAENTSAPLRTLEVGLFTSIIPPLPAPGLGVRVSLMGDGPVAFEMEAEWLDAGRHLYRSDQIVWHYVLQAVHELRAGGQRRPKVFATYGVSGWSERSSTLTGFHNVFIPPFMPSGGVGTQWPMGAHAMLRTDFQVIVLFAEGITLAPRLAVGVSVPIRLSRQRSS
jgi:hypothetical protein